MEDFNVTKVKQCARKYLLKQPYIEDIYSEIIDLIYDSCNQGKFSIQISLLDLVKVKIKEFEITRLKECETNILRLLNIDGFTVHLVDWPSRTFGVLKRIPHTFTVGWEN